MRFQILYRLSFRFFSKSAIDSSSIPAAPLFAFTRLHASHTTCLEISNGFAFSKDSSHLPWLIFKSRWLIHPLRSIPITEPSSLLRGDPPLYAASVLSSLWVLHLDFSLHIGVVGS